MSQLSLVLIAPTHTGMARLSWPGWLSTYQDGSPTCRVTHQSTHQARRWLTSLMRPTTILTKPDRRLTKQWNGIWKLPMVPQPLYSQLWERRGKQTSLEFSLNCWQTLWRRHFWWQTVPSSYDTTISNVLNIIIRSIQTCQQALSTTPHEAKFQGLPAPKYCIFLSEWPLFFRADLVRKKKSANKIKHGQHDDRMTLAWVFSTH